MPEIYIQKGNVCRLIFDCNFKINIYNAIIYYYEKLLINGNSHACLYLVTLNVFCNWRHLHFELNGNYVKIFILICRNTIFFKMYIIIVMIYNMAFQLSFACLIQFFYFSKMYSVRTMRNWAIRCSHSKMKCLQPLNHWRDYEVIRNKKSA